MVVLVGIQEVIEHEKKKLKEISIQMEVDVLRVLVGVVNLLLLSNQSDSGSVLFPLPVQLRTHVGERE